MKQTDTSESTRSRIWSIFNSLREARKEFGVSGPALTSLQSILSFLAEDGPLVIYASNKSITARCMKSEASLRRHLGELETCGLIKRTGSSNGKRYRVKNPTGDDLIFGIDISPLLDAAQDIEAAAETVQHRAALLRYHRHALYALLSEISDRQEADLGGIDLDGVTLAVMRDRLRRETCIKRLNQMHEQLCSAFDVPCKMSGREAQNERHIQESQKEYLLNEEDDIRRNAKDTSVASTMPVKSAVKDKEEGSLGIANGKDVRISRLMSIMDIMRACPGAMQFASQPLQSIEDILDFAWKLGSYIPIPESLMRKAAESKGLLAVAMTVLGLVERGDKIRNAAGYFRTVMLGKKASTFAPDRFLLTAKG